MIGYCVPITPQMASFRLRVAIPAAAAAYQYEIGATGDKSFFYKHFETDAHIAKNCGPFVYDVVNDHFEGKYGQHYRLMCGMASLVTCSSEAMAETVRKHTFMTPLVVDDPYETEEAPPLLEGGGVLWFGHQANIKSLHKYLELPNLTICSNLPHDAVVPWSQDEEKRQLEKCSIVLMTGTNPGASSNRVVKALRAGRFVVTPGGVPAWEELRDYIWVGDVEEGIAWALNNREEACKKIALGQAYVRVRNCPTRIAAQWTGVFDSI